MEELDDDVIVLGLVLSVPLVAACRATEGLSVTEGTHIMHLAATSLAHFYPSRQGKAACLTLQLQEA